MRVTMHAHAHARTRSRTCTFGGLSPLYGRKADVISDPLRNNMSLSGATARTTAERGPQEVPKRPLEASKRAMQATHCPYLISFVEHDRRF